MNEVRDGDELWSAVLRVAELQADVERLREKARVWWKDQDTYAGQRPLVDLLREVAEDARREAEAEVEQLRSRVSSLETQWAESDTAAAIFQAMSRADEAEARLAEALAQRDEARATKDMHKERQEEAWAEVERLKLSMLAHFNDEHLAGDGPEIDRWKREVARLQADVEQLRAALEEMVNCPVGGSGQRLPTPETVARARAALRGEGEKP